MSQAIRDKFISLFEKRPELLSEWHPTKNGTLSPDSISFGSGQKIWWQCAKGHEWQAVPYSRNQGRGCPYCSNQRVLYGWNDLETNRPDIAEDWDDILNDCSPRDVIIGSNKKYHWKCKKCGHQWVASVNVRMQHGCRECSKQLISRAVHASALRKKGALSVTHPEVVHAWDFTKNNNLTPNDVTAGSHQKVWWMCPQGHHFCTTVDAYVRSQGCPICTGKQILAGYNDLESQYPRLLAEWDYERNEELPSQIHMHSEKKVWWICSDCQHSWETRVALRTMRGAGCPKCAAKLVGQQRHQSLLEQGCALSQTHALLVDEWHPTKNTITPNDVVAGDNRKVWWLGKCGHAWEAAISSRVRGCGCPICAGKQVLAGWNDLSSRFPEIAAELDEPDITSDMILATSRKVMRWLCGRCGHRYTMAVDLRTIRHYGCPHCTNRRSISETFILYYLQTINIEAIPSYKPSWLCGRELDIFIPCIDVGVEYDGMRYHQNAARDATKSDLCIQHHVTLVRIREHGCAVLESDDIIFEQTEENNHQSLSAVLHDFFKWLHNEYQFPMPHIDVMRDMQAVYALRAKDMKENSIASVAPHLLLDWDVNNIVQLQQVSYGSNIKILWVCHICGYKWTATAASRVRGNGCPACAHRAVWVGKNDLATTHPQLAREWHEIKNQRTPQEVMAGSQKKVWWKCDCGHEWQARIYARVAGAGCPICARLSRGGMFDFAALGIPCGAELVFQPDPELNIFVANDGRSIVCDGRITSLTAVVLHYFGSYRHNITQFFRYNGIGLDKLKP